MLEKLKKLKAKRPWVFWVVVVVLILVSVGIAIPLLAAVFRGDPPDRSNLDTAARNEGEAKVHQQQADQARDQADTELKKLSKKRHQLRKLMKNLSKKSEKYRKTLKESKGEPSWDDLDKKAGV